MLNPEKSVPFEIKTLSKFECLSTKAWSSYVGDDRRVTISDHSRRKFTKDFTKAGERGAWGAKYLGLVWAPEILIKHLVMGAAVKMVWGP